MSFTRDISNWSASIRRTRRHFGPLVWSERRALALGFLGTIGFAAMQLARPWPIKAIFDFVLLDRVPVGAWERVAAWMLAEPTSGVVLGCASLLAIVGLQNASRYLESLTLVAAAQRIVFEVRARLFDHVQRMALDFHGAARSGDLLARLTDDVVLLREILTETLVVLGGYVLVLLGTVAVMTWLDPSLALVVLVAVPLIVLTAIAVGSRVREAAALERSREGHLAAGAHEALVGIQAIQAFTREDVEEGRFVERSRLSLLESLRARRLEMSLTQLNRVLVAVGTAAVLGLGVVRVRSGALTPGDLLVLMAYANSAYRMLAKIARSLTRASRALAASDRIVEVLETEPGVRDRDGVTVIEELRGALRFERVSFGYVPGRPVLRNVSFEVAPGELVAIVGPTGSGKSTIFNLLLRFCDPWEGRILVDGIDVREITIASLRKQMSVALQKSFLFGVSVHDNIAFGRPKATRNQVARAARKARALEFIANLPNAYEAEVGERGVRLSGGQKRRLSIARAFLRKSSILLLDEPSDGLDAETEAQVAAAIRKLMRGRTTLVIAHRLGTVLAADRVLLMRQGEIVASGTHDRLYAKCAEYARLCDLHFLGAGASARVADLREAVASRVEAEWGADWVDANAAYAEEYGR